MSWPAREYSKGEIRRAGRLLREWYVGDLVAQDLVEQAQAVLANWRHVHGFARNSAAMGLRQRAASREIMASIASRTKARASIFAKLALRDELKLDSLRDIAGCRAVVGGIEQIRILQRAYVEEGHRIKGEPLDYIMEPKASGYRAVHLDALYEDRYSNDEPRRVELQLRTVRQHAWADRVEEVGRALNVPLKSGRGPSELLHRFHDLADVYAEIDAGGLSAGRRASLERAADQLQRHIDDMVAGGRA